MEWVHCLFLFPFVLGKMKLSHAKLCLFLCSYIIYFRKTLLFSFLEIKFQNCAHLKKGLFLTYFSHILVTRKKLQIFLQHISHSHTYMHFAHSIDFFFFFFFALLILKKIEFIRYGFFSVGYLELILIRATLEQSVNIKMVSKI